MNEEIAKKYNPLSEKDFLFFVQSIIERNISNIGIASVIWKDGKWLDAWGKIQGSKDSLVYLQNIINEKIKSLGQNENNSN